MLLTKKTKLLIAAGAVILVTAGLVIALVVLRRPMVAPRSTEISRQGIQTPESTINLALESALRSGDVNQCERAGTRDERDQCFSFVAVARGDEKICSSIASEVSRAACESRSALARIRAEKDWNACGALADPVAERACIATAVEAGATEQFCGSFGSDDRGWCLDRLRLKSAASNPASCSAISDPDLKRECEHGAASATAPPPSDSDGDGLDDSEEAALGTDQNRVDSDSDGLTDGEEVETYGTDPKNSDSDGDGFSDGTEVKNGFNPKGPGRL